ncbi:MAG TPA: DUF4350 domain-containing protein [Steroidobacteraceae bacterium]
MKDRLLTLGLALAALFCFYALFVPKPGATLPQSQPLSSDAGPDGYLAAWRWLDAQHVPLASLRDRYTGLASPEVAPAAFGNVLVMTLPQQLPFRADEWRSLDEWVQAGNTLLILAALDDTPRWTFGANPSPQPALARIGRMSFTTSDAAPSLRDWLRPQSIESVPQGEHPLMQGVRSLYAITELPASRWAAHNTGDTLSLRLARLSNIDRGALWLKPFGRGQLLVCAFATLLSNRALDHADNARLLANLVAWARSGAGRVIFDDAHQGLVRFYDPGHFFADPRLHRTLLWLLLLWLAFVLGPQRLRAAVDGWHRLDETALLEASGRFYTRAVDPLDAQRALFANFFDALRRRIGVAETGEPVWDWLQAQASVTGARRDELQRLYARTCAGERVPLPRLHNLLSVLQERLQ